jgi:EAL domain-containing protein (putative c-di-GMP-specific phosphodiesterase class I)
MKDAPGIASFQQLQPELAAALTERGAVGLLRLDLSFLERIEGEYGLTAWKTVRGRIAGVLDEQRGKEFRAEDQVALDESGGSGLLILLSPKRRRATPVTNADVAGATERIRNGLLKALGRTAFPYFKHPPAIPVGGSLALHNPLLSVQRVVRTAIDDARRRAEHAVAGLELEEHQRIQDLISSQRVVTAYQPIMRMEDRSVMAVEALSRGARGTGFEAANLLFGGADRHGLMIELDRLCRSRALLCSSRVPGSARIFVNTLPATIRDPQFRDKPLIDFLDRAQVAPNRIVIEITEKLVIENYGLFLETMAYFAELGMRFAVDDVGSGYSGLEAISRLKPDYLKIDMSLVRNVHESAVNREMVKAIIALGKGIGSEVIAEGIEVEPEFDVLKEMGADYGQGYLLARPEIAPDPVV